MIKEFIYFYLAYPKGAILLFTVFILFLWTNYLVFFKKNYKQLIYKVYYLYSFLILFWILTNAYFQLPFLRIGGEEMAKNMAILANIISSFAAIVIFYFSHLISNTKETLSKKEKIFVFFIIFQNFFLNLTPDLTIEKVLILGETDFRIIQGQFSSIFFVLSLSPTILIIRNFFKAIKKRDKKIENEKFLYLLYGILFLVTSTIIFHVVVPVFFKRYDFVWIPPAFSILDVLIVGYGVLSKRFFDLRLSLQNYLVYISNALIYLFPLFIFIKLYQTGEITQRVLIGHFFIFSSLAIFFWKRTRLKCDIFWNYVLYQKKENPREEIQQSLSKFQESFATGVNSLALALGIKKLQFVFIKEKKAKTYQPIFDFFQENPEQELVKEEIDYTIENINPKRGLKKIQETMQKHLVSAAIPVLNKQEKLIGILILEQKTNGKLFSVQEIKETKKLLKNSLVYLSKSKKNEKTEPSIEKDFLNGLMHEIRHPLVMASNMKEMIDWEKLNTDDQQFLNSSQKDLFSLSQNLDKISEAVHWQHQSVLTEKSFGTIQSLFDSFLNEDFGGKMNLKIDSDLAQKMFEFDFHNLKRAFQEIIKNAFFFNKQKEKKLEIEVKEADEKIIINFADNGMGIEKDSWEKVFDLLFVEAFSRNPSECGMGIGLTIAKGILMAHDGEIKVLKSEKKKGTTFSVSLPLDSLDS